MTRPLLVSTLAVMLAAGSAGCVSLDDLEAGLAAPLHGEPASFGLVVVDADVSVDEPALDPWWTDVALETVVLARVGGANQLLRCFAPHTRKLWIFPQVPPGRWQILTLDAVREQELPGKDDDGKQPVHYDIPPELAEAFSLDVRAGEAVYVGIRITEVEGHGERIIDIAPLRDPQAELKAWKWMSRLYDATVWGPALRARCESLAGNAQTTAAEPAAR